MKKQLIAFIFAFLLCMLCISCGKENPPIKPSTPVEEYFQYHYLEDDVKSISTECQSLNNDFISRIGYSFQGVYNAPNGNGIQYFTKEGKLIEGMQLTSDLNLYAKWEIKTYTMLFISDGKTYKTDSIVYGSSLNIAEVPIKTGYTFAGWADKKGTLFTNEIGYYEYGKSFLTAECGYTFNEKENIVILYATFNIKKYKVIYDYNGKGTNVETIVPHGSKLILPKVENDYEDFEFFGWSYDDSILNPKYYSNEEIKDELTLYAIWIQFKTFTFKKGNDVVYTIRVYNDGSTKDISDIEEFLQLDGYEYKGCYRNSSFSGSSKVTTFYYGTAETEFYLDYTPITFTLKLATDDKTTIDNGIYEFSYTIEDEIELPKATKENYIFLGWCLEAELTSKPIHILAKGTFGEITLYSKFKGENRKVIYDPKDGKLAVTNDIVEYDAPFKLKVPTLSGYVFDGWYVLYDDEEIKITDSNGTSIINWFIPEEEIIVYAKYLKKHSITILVNDSKMGSIRVKEFYVKGEEVTLTSSCKVGYHLEGFYFDNILLGGDGVKFIMEDKDLIISAIFAPNLYILTLNPNGGELKNLSIEVKFGENITLPLPGRACYSFEGWEYKENIYKESIFWEYPFNAELKAIWTEVENSYEIKTIDDLLAIANNPAGHYFLSNDLDLNGMDWKGFEFTGILNGLNHSISNLSIVSDNVSSGIFTNVSGKISNLNLENIMVKSTSISLVNIGGLCSELTGTLEDISISGEISAEFANIGGLVGKMSNGAMFNCINNATVKGSSIETGATVGGLVGNQIAGSIRGCKNYGEIFNKYNAGGLIGCLNTNDVTDLNNYGKVSGENNVGGIVGYLDKGGTYIITDLNNHGLINGTNYVGGLIGYLRNYVSVNGYDSVTHTETMTKVKNSGTIKGTNYVGGIVGYAHLDGRNTYSSYRSCNIALSASNWENTADITGTSYVGGLLGYAYSNHTDSKISLGTSSGTITAEYYIGGLAGKLEYINLYNCSNENTQIKATGYLIDGSNSYAYVGGYAGYGYTIEECINNIEILYTERGSYVGGLLGYSNGQVRNCTNNASITANKSNYVGGLIGYRTHDGTFTETGLENTGTITGAEYVGGLIGYLRNYVSVNSYDSVTHTETMTKVKNSGTIKGTNYVGGIVGYAHLDGRNTYSSYRSCNIALSASNWENTADITGTSYVGGLLGYAYSNNSNSIMVDCTQTGVVVGSGESVDNFIGSNTNITIMP